MTGKNLTSSSTTNSHFFNRQRSDSNPDSISSSSTTNRKSIPLVKRRFSATKMLAKAKDTTKSLVHEVLDKRHSLDSKRSANSIDDDEQRPKNAILRPSSTIESHQSTSSSSLTSLEKLKMPSTISVSTNNLIDDNSISRKLSSRQKHYSLPIRRPFTIKKDKSHSLESSLSSLSSSSSTTPAEQSESTSQPKVAPLNAAAAAEADILSGAERPGSFATACDFRLANEKRNEEFHALFKSVQENDMLIQDYKCALQKDILLQGHLYVSEHHVCFKSNIFGWVTNLVINFEEITDVEKKMTAKIIPNGITISTSTSKHVFASFLSRDQAYDQIVKIWDLCKRANSVIPSTSSFDENNSFYEEGETDEEEEESSIPSIDSAVLLNSPLLLITTEEDRHDDKLLVDSTTNNSSTPNKNISKSNSTTTTTTLPPSNKATTTILERTLSKRPRAASDSYRERRDVAEPKAESGSKRENILRRDVQVITPIKKTRVCPCTVKGEQYSHIALNETYTGSVEAMFKLLFDSGFFIGFLERYENFEDVQVGVWKHGTREVIGKRRIKSATMGTKIVKTLFQEKRIHRKYPYYSCVTAKKSMPDMPMGAVYSIQSRTCITRVSEDKVHVLVTFQVAFSKSGLVSSIIEKNAADDQLRQYSHLRSILDKPDLIRELVQDRQLLHDLDMNDKTSHTTSNHHLQKQSPKDWVSYAMNRVTSIRLIDFMYIGFFLVLLTHCVLALRLQRITHRLEIVQQHKNQRQYHQQKDARDSQWINQKMDHVHQRLNQLKGEVQDYDQRIFKMRNVQ